MSSKPQGCLAPWLWPPQVQRCPIYSDCRGKLHSLYLTLMEKVQPHATLLGAPAMEQHWLLVKGTQKLYKRGSGIWNQPLQRAIWASVKSLLPSLRAADTTHSPSMLTVMLLCVRCLFSLMLLVINICTYINLLLAEQSYAGEHQTSQTQSTLPACDSTECGVKSRRFHFAEVMLTYIISCEITKKDCDILLPCQSGCSPALAWVQSPLPPSSSNKANRKPHTFGRCLSWKVWSMVTPSNGIEKTCQISSIVK